MRTATEQRVIDRRKTRFLRALEAAGQSQNAWAKERGVSKGHLSLVLSGDRPSASLTDKIDAFIAEHLGDSTTALALQGA